MLHYVSLFIAVLILAATTNSSFCEEKKPVETILSVYPETVAFGDTCYVLVTVVNRSGDAARGMTPHFQFINDYIVQFDVSRHGKTWYGTFECLSYKKAVRDIWSFLTIPTGETIVFMAVPLQFPPLEDLYQDKFWTEMREELKNNPEGLPVDFEIIFSPPGVRLEGEDFFAQGRLAQKVTIKLRNEKETAMIDRWYRDTPDESFPRYVKGAYLSKVPRKDYCVIDSKIINVDGKKYSPYYFTNLGNRYPGGPNCPETWRGWKELEESLAESTMRDEIRLTRMLIQYCDTKDEAVLEELGDWFAEMNEIQRIVTARSVRQRARSASGTAFQASFRDIYKTVREHDLCAIGGSEMERLKALELRE